MSKLELPDSSSNKSKSKMSREIIENDKLRVRLKGMRHVITKVAESVEGNKRKSGEN